ncbi:beta-ketoacyl synthase N-terminal-like domain-containing protein [Microbulbifer spongiae]|uniref:Phosphopantetheine-binding protein n=1 Tax=Microbulbifer spongiae TaxID=2944933 RepID=A0ABY9E851_9GAMM|nr:beta-ketoacyl synthase N-terminal-like domain-containing protein [Microbulbifer sp. MI-G]WKD49183.1 phosphopantetheine-binding protein [Microbulbifer sp. MI-G]
MPQLILFRSLDELLLMMLFQVHQKHHFRSLVCFKMNEIFHKNLAGYLLLPLLDASQKCGLFSALRVNSYQTLDSLVKATAIGKSRLSWLLELLENTGLVVQQLDKGFRLRQRLQQLVAIDLLTELYHCQPEQLAEKLGDKAIVELSSTLPKQHNNVEVQIITQSLSVIINMQLALSGTIEQEKSSSALTALPQSLMDWLSKQTPLPLSENSAEELAALIAFRRHLSSFATQLSSHCTDLSAVNLISFTSEIAQQLGRICREKSPLILLLLSGSTQLPLDIFRSVLSEAMGVSCIVVTTEMLPLVQLDASRQLVLVDLTGQPQAELFRLSLLARDNVHLVVMANNVPKSLSDLLANAGITGSGQWMIEAAGRGWFDQTTAVRIPASGSWLQASLHTMELRDYSIRNACYTDIPRLSVLEQLCWDHSQIPNELLAQRIARYPAGQLVLEYQGAVIGVVYSQRINRVSAIFQQNYLSVHELHDDSGHIVQLLAINLHPDFQHLMLGDQLLEFTLQKAALTQGVDRVVGVTLCKNYTAAKHRDFAQYIQCRDVNQDTILAFHRAHGAEIVSSVANYRPEDSRNQHKGVLVSYDIDQRTVARNFTNPTTANRAYPFSEADIRQELSILIGTIVDLDEQQLDPEQPLMEMGLDSADLLKLQGQLETKYGLRLSSKVFFLHNNLIKLSNFVAGELTGKSSVCDKLSYKKTTTGTDPSGIVSQQTIAVVGVACQLPGGINNPQQFWKVLQGEQCVIGEYPKSRGLWLNAEQYPGTQWGGFIEDVDRFDAAFFRISPVEAVTMDPQQRLLMQATWHCLEDACIAPDTLQGSETGVYIGISNIDYGRAMQDSRMGVHAYFATGSALSVAANRISYFFDFCGPSMVMDTACSSSLVALHQAITGLRQGHCQLALAGGANVICHPYLSLAYNKAGMLAGDGRCKSFDSKANGYVRSEGIIMLALKHLADAEKSGDRIHALIPGSASNHGGLAGGLTVPNAIRQQELLNAAWKDAGITADQLSYLEAHGTGTSLGDPIEIEAIRSAMANSRSIASCHCLVGSVKTNIGHLESAAGLAGVLKVILMMQHKQIPASLHFQQLNPEIELQDSGLAIASRAQAWHSDNHSLLAGVSSFGSGGANAHVVLKNYAAPLRFGSLFGEGVVVLSAKTPEALKANVRAIKAWAEEQQSEAHFAAFLYTLQTARAALRHRLAFAASSFSQLIRRLDCWLQQQHTSETFISGEVIGSPVVTYDQSLVTALDKARAWCAGKIIDFSGDYHEIPDKLRLPGYVFQGKRHWFVTQQQHTIVDDILGDISQRKTTISCEKNWLQLPDRYIFNQEQFRCLSLNLLLESACRSAARFMPGVNGWLISELRYQPAILTDDAAIRLRLDAQLNNSDSLAILFSVIRQHGAVELATLTIQAIKDVGLQRSESTYIGTTPIVVSEIQGQQLPNNALSKILPLLVREDTGIISIRNIEIYPMSAYGRQVTVVFDQQQIEILAQGKTVIKVQRNPQLY